MYITILEKFKSNMPKKIPFELFNLHYQKDSRFIEDKLTDKEFYLNYLRLIFNKRKFESHDFFNPEILIECLPNIKLKDGYTLDFVYQTANRIGLPLLYVRKVETEPFIKVTQHENWLKKNSLLDYILLDGTKDSYIQIIIFMELGDKFFLYEHALYNKIDLILSIKDFNDIFKEYNFILEPNEREKLSNINFNPNVEFLDEDEVKVSYYTFTEFGGLIEKQKIFTNESKLVLKLEFEKHILNFNSGVMY